MLLPLRVWMMSLLRHSPISIIGNGEPQAQSPSFSLPESPI